MSFVARRATIDAVTAKKFFGDLQKKGIGTDRNLPVLGVLFVTFQDGGSKVSYKHGISPFTCKNALVSNHIPGAFCI